MIPCPSCRAPITETSRFCSSCGAPTTTSSPTVAGVASQRGGDTIRFSAGTTIAGRYRIIGLLGRGGMGEVYRADDLKLDQPVALKFLPASLADNPAALAAFHSEVRLARQISHPNVCRVYDIGEVDGAHYLTMEFVDGEDLAALLRRIGHLPGDKIAQIARQLCAGLAAAHDKGVLHRDLKPSNIMIDSRGDARIADFGLAGIVGNLAQQDDVAGTPAYMAPEQFGDGGVSVQSDLYSVGLILYEMTTGRRAFDADQLLELIRQHQEAVPVRPSDRIEGVSPLLERSILRCLEKNPSDRPTSALSLAALLPGSDPLAEALAAGQTPSPEMVAAAGQTGAMTARTATILLTSYLLAVVVCVLINSRLYEYRFVPLPKKPDALEDRAREFLDRIDMPRSKGSHARAFDREPAAAKWIKKETPAGADRWKRFAEPGLSPIVFWYREFANDEVPRQFRTVGQVTRTDPPFNTAGMSTVLLDPAGRLLQINAIPPRIDDSLAVRAAPPAWGPWFAAAGLDTARFHAVTPVWNPSYYVDGRAAWRGTRVEAPKDSFTVEAASYHGRPVRFVVQSPWTSRDPAAGDLPAAQKRAQAIITLVLLSLILIGGYFITQRNLRLERADRSGASRVARAIGWFVLAGWALTAHHSSDIGSELSLFFLGLAVSVLNAMLAWLIYISVEPYVRRARPQILIGWTRLLAHDGWRDPAVGRDVLIGCVAGTALHLCQDSVGFVTLRFAGEEPFPLDPNLLLGGSTALGNFLEGIIGVVLTPLIILVLYVLGKLLLKKEWLALAIPLLLLGLSTLSQATSTVRGVAGIAFTTLIVWLIFRRGFLVSVAALTVAVILGQNPVVPDPGAWYFATALTLLALLAALGVSSYLGARGRLTTRR